MNTPTHIRHFDAENPSPLRSVRIAALPVGLFAPRILLVTLVVFVMTCSVWGQGRIVPAQPVLVAEAPHGRLERIGQGDDGLFLLFVWGTPEEMGAAHGRLLKDSVQKHCDHLIAAMSQAMGEKPEMLDEVYMATRPHIPAHFIGEMEGLAKGAGIPLQTVIRCQMIGEASEWHCSLFGAWGKATAGDGHTYQLRALDYNIRAEIQRFPTIIVYVPQQGHPFANIGWAGIVGSVTGISSVPLAISEIGDDYDKANDSFDGIPFPFLLRDILQFDEDLDAAIARVKNARRTSSLMYAIGDGRKGRVNALQTSRTLCNVFTWDNLEPNVQTHPRLEDVVYWGMSWNVPKYDQALHDQLKVHYGNINAVTVIENILPTVRTGNLQATVYDLTAMKIWTANARAEGETGPLNAYERTFVEVDMKAVFQRAKELAK
jgi:isopenicillin-N N-acyltransferase-like protein